jgi:hypothetical protein
VLEHKERQFKVEGAEIFRDCIRLATRLANTDVEALIQSAAEADSGQSELLTDEVWVGLDHTHNAEGEDMSG